MSFLNIKDPEERAATIEDYLALKKRIKESNLEERGNLMDRRRELEETFKLIVASNEQMTRDIIKDLEPITEGLHELNRNLEMRKPQRIAGKRKRENMYGPLAARIYRNYLNPNVQVDKTFGIRYEDGKPMIGDKLIDIVGYLRVFEYIF